MGMCEELAVWTSKQNERELHLETFPPSNKHRKTSFCIKN